MTPDPGAAPTAGQWLLLAAAFTPPFIFYWLPTILGIWRRNSRMGLVIFTNLFGFLLLPWFSAMTIVLGEYSHRPRKSSPAVPWSAPAPEQSAAILPPPAPPAPRELPANVTPLRPAGESHAAKAARLMRDWGR